MLPKNQDTIERFIKKTFGIESFKVGQKEIIGALLSKRDAMLMLPTGGGKSLCFQAPSVILGGLTVVITPIISLMVDQVRRLRKIGISAGALHSGLNANERRDLLHSVITGDCQYLFTTPETLSSGSFKEIVAGGGRKVDLVAIDEAHCCIEWGNSFRPIYKRVGEEIDKLDTMIGYRPPRLVMTATATDEATAKILKCTKLANPLIIKAPYWRANLCYRVIHVTQETRDAWMLSVLNNYKNSCCLVFCPTTANVEKVVALLRDSKILAKPYHAKLDPEDRSQNQREWMSGQINVMVCTSAFGMGVDKRDVRLVLHYGMPASLESYAQEAGRAGRDGGLSECVLLTDILASPAESDGVMACSLGIPQHKNPIVIDAVSQLLEKNGCISSDEQEITKGAKKIDKIKIENVHPALKWCVKVKKEKLNAKDVCGIADTLENMGLASKSGSLLSVKNEIEIKFGGRLAVELVKPELDRLQAVIEYASSDECRAKHLMRYFAHKHSINEDMPGCGKCDNCKQSYIGDTTSDEYWIMRAIKDSGGVIGSTKIQMIVAGENEWQTRLRNRHYDLAFGQSDLSTKALRGVLNALIKKRLVRPVGRFNIPNLSIKGANFLASLELENRYPPRQKRLDDKEGIA